MQWFYPCLGRSDIGRNAPGMKVDMESPVARHSDVESPPSLRIFRPNGALYRSPGQGRHDRRPGLTAFQGSGALKGRIKAAIKAVWATVLDRPYRALVPGGLKSRGGALLCPGLK